MYAIAEGWSGSGGGGAILGVMYVANSGGYREPSVYALTATDVVKAAVLSEFVKPGLAELSALVDANLRGDRRRAHLVKLLRSVDESIIETRRWGWREWWWWWTCGNEEGGGPELLNT